MTNLPSPSVPSPDGPASEKLSSYHWKLLIFLSVATFFEGYDFMALTQILPSINTEFGLSKTEAGFMLGAINAGTVFAFLLVRRADRWGRKRVLTITIVGYTLFTFITGLTTDVITFTIAQFFARMFLIAEWATATVYAAEEFPASKRATLIGVIQAFSSFGAIACAGVVPLLLKSDLSWRMVYFVGVIPLAVLAVGRRSLQETKRFVQAKAEGIVGERKPLLSIFSSGYGKRVLLIAAAWGLTYMGTQNAVQFWKAFVMEDRGFTDGEVGAAITMAAVGAMPVVFFAGKLLDVVGRKMGATVIFCITAASIVGAYSFHDRTLLTVSLGFAIFGVSAVLPVLNNYTAELFPIDYRSDAFVWGNNLLGRIGYVLGPILVGALATDMGWGMAVSITAVFPMLALVVIWIAFPETKGQELEQTAAV
ncbi:MAG: MFS transporter [Myxococcales bacterium]|nr:MFS transporter [Myxococcales bacterium]